MKRLGRRSILASAGGAALLTSGCAPPARPNSVAPSEVYVGLGRAREVAILDAIADRVVGRVPLRSLGEQGAPAQITVGPSGSAALLPLVSTVPVVGLIQQQEAPARSFAKPEAPSGPRVTRQTALLRLGEKQPSDAANRSPSAPEAAQRMTADGEGIAYVVLGDASSRAAPDVAVIEMRTGQLRRRLQVAQTGEQVLALQADAEGRRLFASIWTWGDQRRPMQSWGRGRFVALDAPSGAMLARAPLPEESAIVDLQVASPPAGPPRGGQRALFGVLATPGPARDETIMGGVDRHYALVALDPDFLDVVTTWELAQRPSALALTPDGRRAYLLSGTGAGVQSRDLSCLDLASGQLTHRWPLPDGCFAMALSPVGKLYIADALGDRLWRVDVQRNVLLGDIPLPGAPLTLAARPF